MNCIKYAGVAGVVAAMAGAAQGAVFFTFEDPSTMREISYTQPAAGETFGLLKYNSNIQLSLDVDLTEEGGAQLAFNNTTLTKTAMVGEVTSTFVPGIGTIYTAPISGEFSFESGGEVILSAVYSNATLTIINDVGVKAASIQTGNLSYTASGSLATQLDNINKILAAPFDAAFTLTALSNVGTSNPDGDEEGPQFFNTFWANAAYTGTSGAAVPSPGSMLLALSAGAVATRRRRRA